MTTTRFNLPRAVLAISLAMAITNVSAESNSYDRTDTNGSDKTTQDNGSERDRSDESLTPMDQSNDKRDIELTANIRQLLTQDESLSVNAQNIKVISRGGKVTLRGPVETAQERSKVMAMVQKVAGVNSVDNQLEVDKN